MGGQSNSIWCLHRSGSSFLTLSEIHAALAYYYYDHQEEIDAAFAEDEELRQTAERERVQASR